LQAKNGNLVIVAALIAGVVIGFAGSTVSYSRHWLRPPGSYGRHWFRPLREQPFERMSRALRLTPLQHAQINAILQESRHQLGQARQDFAATQRRVMVKAFLRAQALLNPEQRIQFDREFVPPELLKQAHAAVNQEASASSAPIEVPTSTATPSALPRSATLTDRSGG
jgi:hypothetical protein